jgi:hypothetical protein
MATWPMGGIALPADLVGHSGIMLAFNGDRYA